MNGRLAFRWRRAAAMLAGLSCCGGPAVAQDLAESRRTTKEAYVNKRDFEIPVELKKAPDQIKELHLYISADQGQTWQPPRKAPPTRKTFIFKAPTDGEYQFTLGHERLDGTKVPADVKSRPAGMRVVVDTVQPDVRLRPLRSAADQKVGVAWTIEEANPDLKTLTLKLKTAKDPAWHELNARQTIEGKMEWPTDPGDDYVVEVSLTDRAGNKGSKTLDVPGYPSEPVQKSLPPIAKADLPKGDPLDEPIAPKSVAVKPATGMDDILEPTLPKLSRKPEPTVVPELAASKPTVPKGMEPSFSEPTRMERPKPASTPASSVARASEPKPPANVFDPTKIDMPPQKPAGEDEVVAQRAPKKTAEDAAVKLASHAEHEVKKPVEPKIKLVGSPRFRLRYSIAGVGPSGVGAVDLYMTKNNGETWTKAGSDPDLESPIDVTLPGDGQYGLAVVVTNKRGMGQRPPKPGEQPQIKVDVDTDAPLATLKRVDVDPAAPREAMVLTWESTDDHPAERAVDLYYSHDPDLGWFKIALGLPATGNHSWKVPHGVPYQVYFMMVARDQAGNVEKIYSPKPVPVDLSNPQGKIDAIVDVLPSKKGADDHQD